MHWKLRVHLNRAKGNFPKRISLLPFRIKNSQVSPPPHSPNLPRLCFLFFVLAHKEAALLPRRKSQRHQPHHQSRRGREENRHEDQTNYRRTHKGGQVTNARRPHTNPGNAQTIPGTDGRSEPLGIKLGQLRLGGGRVPKGPLPGFVPRTTAIITKILPNYLLCFLTVPSVMVKTGIIPRNPNGPEGHAS
jgi:hypothetical protein